MSVDTRSVFDAARDDAPPSDLHDEMWTRIAGATGIAATAAASTTPAATAAKTASFTAGKLLAIGGLIGAVSTALGVVVALLVLREDPSVSTPITPSGAARVQHAVSPGARLSAPEARKRAESPSSIEILPPAPATAKEESKTDGSDLAEEARLVSSARAALVGGDPQRALTLVQQARRLTSHALEPEELGLEARALSALGRTDEAAATDLLLRRRYPESALAR